MNRLSTEDAALLARMKREAKEAKLLRAEGLTILEKMKEPIGVRPDGKPSTEEDVVDILAKEWDTPTK